MQARWLTPMAAVLLMAASCKDDEARAEIAALKAEVAELKDWLGKSSNPAQKATYNVHAWHMSVFKAICNLEQKANPPATDRLCHPEIDVDHNTPPSPPPWM